MAACRATLVANMPAGSKASSVLKKARLDVPGYFYSVPGLKDKVLFLAWKHRADSPVVTVHTSRASGDDAIVEPHVSVTPRSTWDGEGYNSSVMSEGLRYFFDREGFNPDEQYAVLLLINHLPGLEVGSGVVMEEKFPSSDGGFAQLMDQFISSASITPESFAAEQARLDAIPCYVRLHSLRRQGGEVGGEGYYT
jgi:hypothetical protein